MSVHLPPEDCPNEGVCATILPRLTEAEKSFMRHDSALSRIGTDVDSVKKEVHEIRVVLRERDKVEGFLKTVFVTLLGVFLAGVLSVLVQIGVTVYYAGRMSEKLGSIIATVSDHEIRLRAEERHTNPKE